MRCMNHEDRALMSEEVYAYIGEDQGSLFIADLLIHV